MKNTFIKQLYAALCVSLIVVACTPSDKMNNAESSDAVSKSNLEDSRLLFEAEVKAYQIEMSDRIAQNNKSLAEFAARTSNLRSATKRSIDIRIAELDKRNVAMKSKIDLFTSERKENWSLVKQRFEKDLEGLNKDFEILYQTKIERTL